jgi:alpha-L-fucosidase
MTNPTGPYTPSWNSLRTHPTPQWFQEAKFGIYTHWGVYSVPGFRGPAGTQDVSWYGRNMYLEGTPQYEHHVKIYGGPAKFGYKDFIPQFKGEKFDPDEWAELFVQAGARFAGPVGEHHDGFCMWDTYYTPWSAARLGPRRDVVGALEKSIRRQGLKFLVALHNAENWWFYPHWLSQYDVADPRYAALYGEAHNLDGPGTGPDFVSAFFDQARPSHHFLIYWLGKIIEVIERYGPDLLWFDFGLRDMPDHYKQAALAHYFNWAAASGREVTVTAKRHDLASAGAVVDLEAGRMPGLTHHQWLTDTSVDDLKAWGYMPGMPYKSTTSLVHYLVDNVCKNGHLLLNVGPRPDGTIPEAAADVLRGLGRWLAVNGESIYGTTTWTTHGEGPTSFTSGGSGNEGEVAGFSAHDVRYAVKDNVLYATCLGWPGAEITLAALNHFYPSEIESITLLGDGQPLPWRLDRAGLTIATPTERSGEHAYVFKLVRRPPFG